MHRWSIFIIVQQDKTQSSLFIILRVHSTCFGCQSHPSSGVHKTVTKPPVLVIFFVQLSPINVAGLATLMGDSCKIVMWSEAKNGPVNSAHYMPEYTISNYFIPQTLYHKLQKQLFLEGLIFAVFGGGNRRVLKMSHEVSLCLRQLFIYFQVLQRLQQLVRESNLKCVDYLYLVQALILHYQFTVKYALEFSDKTQAQQNKQFSPTITRCFHKTIHNTH